MNDERSLAMHIGRPILRTPSFTSWTGMGNRCRGSEWESCILGERESEEGVTLNGRRTERSERFWCRSVRGGNRNRRMYPDWGSGKWLATGTIELWGRNDFQLKIRGFSDRSLGGSNPGWRNTLQLREAGCWRGRIYGGARIGRAVAYYHKKNASGIGEAAARVWSGSICVRTCRRCSDSWCRRPVRVF